MIILTDYKANELFNARYKIWSFVDHLNLDMILKEDIKEIDVIKKRSVSYLLQYFKKCVWWYQLTAWYFCIDTDFLWYIGILWKID